MWTPLTVQLYCNTWKSTIAPKKAGQSLWGMHLMPLSWHERQAGCREDCTCFSSPTYRTIWVFRTWGTWQGSHKPHRCWAKGNPLPPSWHAQGSASSSSVRRGQRWETEHGNSPCSSLELCHSWQLLHQKKERNNASLRRQKVTLLHLGEGCESGELYWSLRAAWSQQPAAHQSSSDLQMLLIYLQGAL